MGTATNQEKDDISSLSIHVVVVQIVQGQQGNVPENVVYVQNCCSTNVYTQHFRVNESMMIILIENAIFTKRLK